MLGVGSVHGVACAVLEVAVGFSSVYWEHALTLLPTTLVVGPAI